jgi:hypothetical protein
MFLLLLQNPLRPETQKTYERDLLLNKAMLIIYNTFLSLSLNLALKEEPKHVAVISNLIFFNSNC